VAAMNPCPCGFHRIDDKRCTCLSSAIDQYRRRASGPLLDRFDLRLDLAPVTWRDLQAASPGEASADVRSRVLASRERQLARQGALNCKLEGTALRQYAYPVDAAGTALLGRAIARFGLSARGLTRVQRVARTIADLEASEAVEARHVAEALHFRMADQAASDGANYEIADSAGQVW
jgi:magnesium chelatase family protein